MLEHRWITTGEASRIVTVTNAGQAGLREWLGRPRTRVKAFGADWYVVSATGSKIDTS